MIADLLAAAGWLVALLALVELFRRKNSAPHEVEALARAIDPPPGNADHGGLR